MLYKFKSKVTGDLIMLEPNGRQILAIIGKPSDGADAAKGIITPEQIPAAIAALEQAVAQDEAARAAAKDAGAGKASGTASDAISLRQRALPFLDMLRRCQQAGEEVLWGV